MKIKLTWWGAALLVIVMILFNVLAVKMAPASQSNKADNYYDVLSYRSGESYTAPSKEGMVFAGWYTDAALTQPLSEDLISGMAYAKFVDADVLSVKWQMSANTTADSEATNLRLLTTVDSLDYKQIGFIVEATGKPARDLTSRTVYREVRGYLSGNGQTYAPSIFSEESTYFLAHTLTGIPKSDFDSDITATPKWITLDGTVVTGVPLIIKISNT